MVPLRAWCGPVLAGLAACFVHACLGSAPREPQAPRWWKGNTHTHTLWSDGDGAPQAVAQWYRENGYHFLVLSDHNLLSTGETWFPVEEGGRLTPERLDELIAIQPVGAVRWREVDGRLEMRLTTLDELRARLEVPGRFLFIQGEEVTSQFEGIPVHTNALNTREVVGAQVGASVREVLQANLAAVAEQGRRLGMPTLAHVNHPNFQWGLTWEDLAACAEDRFFEVYNGHPGTGSRGDELHLSTERMWDLALTRRLFELDLGLLYGIASDDSHHYHATGPQLCNSGRGWIAVRARELSSAALIEALRRGDFYASSGVLIDDVQCDAERYQVDIALREGEHATTRFIGTRLVDQAPGEIGVLLAETDADPAVYTMVGDELYVRAVVVSDRAHARPQVQGELQQAWLQPVLGPARP